MLIPDGQQGPALALERLDMRPQFAPNADQAPEAPTRVHFVHHISDPEGDRGPGCHTDAVSASILVQAGLSTGCDSHTNIPGLTAPEKRPQTGTSQTHHDSYLGSAEH